MKDVITIIKLERKTLLRGLFVSLFLIFPFTFLPVLLSSGCSSEKLIQRIPLSTQYAFLMSIVVIIAAIAHNVNSLKYRKEQFNKPAFKALDYLGCVEGIGSIYDSLETFLFGKTGDYIFKINIVDNKTDKKDRIYVSILPFIDVEKDSEAYNALIKSGFVMNTFLKKIIVCSNSDLYDMEFISTVLYNLADIFRMQNIQPVEIDLSNLNEVDLT